MTTGDMAGNETGGGIGGRPSDEPGGAMRGRAKRGGTMRRAAARGSSGFARPARRSRRVVIAVLLVIGLMFGAYWIVLRAQAEAATAYAARIGCSCRFVAGREPDQCEADMMPGMGLVRLSVDDDARSVSASLPLLSRARATYREQTGCMLEPWEG